MLQCNAIVWSVTSTVVEQAIRLAKGMMDRVGRQLMLLLLVPGVMAALLVQGHCSGKVTVSERRGHCYRGRLWRGLLH